MSFGLRYRRRGSRGVAALLAVLVAALAACRSLSDAGGAGSQAQAGAAAAAAPPPRPAMAPSPEPVEPHRLLAGSVPVTWTCDGSPCPWGQTFKGHALAWPEWANPSSKRMGYTASAPIYLPAASANGMSVYVRTGIANVFAGSPDKVRHHELVKLSEGTSSFRIVGITPGNVVSVQGDDPFNYEIVGPRPDAQARDARDARGVRSTLAFWPCDAGGCAEWSGMVVHWPKGTAYQGNNRSGANARSVFSLDDEPLYPYMGAWADGCRVTVEEGEVLIVEWQRGTDVWRETHVKEGRTHVIALKPPEDGALIESNAASPGFRVSFENCHPKPVPADAGKKRSAAPDRK